MQWRCHAGVHRIGHQHGGGKPTESSVAEFCYERNSETLKDSFF